MGVGQRALNLIRQKEVPASNHAPVLHKRFQPLLMNDIIDQSVPNTHSHMLSWSVLLVALLDLRGLDGIIKIGEFCGSIRFYWSVVAIGLPLQYALLRLPMLDIML